jgi:hypothetical protein
VLTGPTVILILKSAVVAVTLILLASIVALLRGRYRLHGQLNLVFMILTLVAVLGLEALIRFYDRNMFRYLFDDPQMKATMRVHLSFAIPSACLLPIMYFTGKAGRRKMHYVLAAIFSVCWIGTFITGVFFLPHTAPPRANAAELR